MTQSSPAPQKPAHHDEHPELSARNSRIGLWLFLVYSIIYAGFIAISCADPKLMASRPFGGVNLAILYGFALIVIALILALVYMYFCKKNADDHREELSLQDEEPDNSASPV